MTTRSVIPTFVASVLLAACGGMGGKNAVSAEASLAPTQGNNAGGQVSFTQADDGVRVEARINGLTPGGHGFHLHEKGDCSAPDATSAGGHFNPTGKPHGHPDKGDHHLGDLPMLNADSSGRASLATVASGLTIGDGGSTDIIGRAVVVHAGPDDYTSQPAGNSGGRVACGVIRAK